ncbi:MAG: DUF1828 domain-containing protein [Cyclonatronaceae bacterium]
MNELLTNISETLSEQFFQHFDMREKRPGIYQLYIPFYHEDGDMVEAYLDLRDHSGQLSAPQQIRISDFGMTLMRLSYHYELDTPNKERIFSRIVAENGLSEENGQLFCNTSFASLYVSVMHFCQVVAKISTMRQFKREVIESLFYEQLEEYIMDELTAFRPVKGVTPIPDRSDLEVDYQLRPNGYPVFLFGVKDNPKSRLATISCLEFLRNDLKFKSFIVHEDAEKLSKKDRELLMSACDKQFPSLKDFTANAKTFLKREASF